MARPSTAARRRTVARTEIASPRPFVRGPRGTGTLVAVEFDVRTVYDFLISLTEDAGTTDELPRDDREWLTAARAPLAGPGSSERLTLDLCIGVAALAIDQPEVRTAGEFVELVAATSPTRLARAVLGDELRDPALRPLIERALAGNEDAFDELRPRLSEWATDERMTILRRPDVYHERTVTLLRTWLTRFREVEDRVAAMIRRDVEARAGERATLDPIQLIETTTGGIRWLPEPGVRRIVLAPSYFARPYNFLLAGDDWRFFAYPIADNALDAADPLAPPAAVLRLHRALGDESRLRILRLLADRDWYLTELAGQLELSKPTVKHHLAQLRAAGLVTVTEEGVLIYYSLRRERLEQAGKELMGFLGS